MIDQAAPDSNDPESWVTLAHLLRPQGRKGELLAELLTDFPDLFAERRQVSLRRPNGAIEPATIESHWLPVGKNAGRIVLKFAGIDSITNAERLAGFDVVIPREDRAPLDEDEQYIADLIGCTLVDGDHTIGIVEDIHIPTNTAGARLSEAAPLLVVRSAASPDDEILIPFAKAWIQSIDIPAKRLEMRLPEGLLDING